MRKNPTTPSADGQATTSRAKWWTLGAVCLATFMLLVDVTIVNVALKSIQDDFSTTFSELEWVVNAYALTLASSLLTWGSLADIFGRKRIFLVGIAVFTLSSVACGLSGSAMALNASRAVQGIGGAAVFATALALLGQEFKGRERGTAFGIWGAVTGGAVAVGPLIGGSLTDQFGWRSIFFVNAPIGVIALIVTVLKLKDPHRRQRGLQLDWAGLLTFSLGLFCLILGLIEGSSQGWGSPQILGLLVASIALLIGFVVVERRQAQPMLDLTLFHKPTFVGASVAALTMSGSIFATFVYVTLYFQNILGATPFQTGLRFLPTTLLSFFVAGAAGAASSRVPVKYLLGTGLVFIGTGLVMAQIFVTPSSSWVAMVVCLCVSGIGVGLVNPPLASTAVGVVRSERGGMASGISSTCRQVGLATAVAGLGAIFQVLLSREITDKLSGTFEPDDVHALANGITSGKAYDAIAKMPYGVQELAGTTLRNAFIHSLTHICLVAGIIAFVGAAVVFATVRQEDFVSTQEPG